MKEYIFKKPMLLSGMLCVIISVLGYYSKITLLYIGIILALILGIMILKKVNGQLVFALLITFIMLISTVMTCAKVATFENIKNQNLTAEITIYEITAETDDYYSAKAYVTSSETLKRGTKIQAFYEPFDLRAGQTVNAELTLKPVSNSAYKANSYSEEIYLTANIKNITNTNKSNFVLTSVGNTRRYIKETLFDNLGYEEASTLCALTFGDRSYFSESFYQNVKSAGVAHVMVVSGMHLSVLVLFFTYICKKILYNRYMTALIMLTAVLLLCAVCGFTMSIMRAGITYIIAALAIILKRHSTPANTLGAAVTVILIRSPFAVLSVAFQLSVLSTFSILAVALPVTEYITSNEFIKSKLLSGMLSIVLTTLSAALMTLPVSIYVFGCISTVGIITNLLISYAVTLLLELSVCALGINLVFPPLARLIFIPLNITAKYVNSVINYFGSLEFSVLTLDPSFAILAVILIIIIFWALLACKNRIDVIKLNKMREKIKREGGKRLKWQ